MRTSSIEGSGFHIRKTPPKDKCTAYYLFDTSDPCNFYKIQLNGVHFRAYNKTLNLPIATDGSTEDWDRLNSELIPTAATPYQIMRHYMDGADIRFHVKDVPGKIYKLIVNHLNAHATAMRTQITYIPPPVESFEEWGEFALALRPMAAATNKFLDRSPVHEGLSFMMTRPSFSAPTPIVAEEKRVIPESTRALNSINSFLEKINEW